MHDEAVAKYLLSAIFRYIKCSHFVPTKSRQAKKSDTTHEWWASWMTVSSASAVKCLFGECIGKCIIS